MPRRVLPLVRALLAAAPWALAACAGGAPPAAVPEPATLEAERARRPDDPDLLRRLGSAYLARGEAAKARDVLAAAQALRAGDPETGLLLGAAYEELGQLDSARAAYRGAAGRANAAQRDLIAGRERALVQKQLAADAREALRREQALALGAPRSGTIAVLPFRYTGTNEELRPLERGLAELVVADLGKVSRLQLLERERVQALLDELRLAESGRAEPATGARSGRLVGAAQVVQGVLSERGDALALDANVVDATDASIDARAGASDRLQRLIDMEKEVVFGLLRGLGIALSPAEQRAISERPTADLQAFLAYSRGLAREDAGDFAGAAGAYREALARDPGFRAAATREAGARQAAAAPAATALPQALAAIGTGGIAPDDRLATLRTSLETVVPSRFTTIFRRTELLPPGTRPPVTEGTNNDDPRSPGLLGQVIVEVPRP